MYKTLDPGALGFGTTLLEAAEAAAACGFEGYWCGAGRDFSAPMEKTKEALEKSGLKAAGFGLPLDFRKDAETFADGLDKLPQYAKYASEIGAKRTMTWILPFHETLDYADNFNLHRDRLKKVAEVLGSYGIQFGLEFVGTPSLRRTGKKKFIENLDETLELCHAISEPNIGVMMDVWHWDFAGHTLSDFSKFSGRNQIAAVHINDAPAGVKPEAQQDGCRTLPGATGVLNVADFFKGLAGLKYDGPVMAEPFDKTLGQMEFKRALDATIKAINGVWPK